MPDNALNNIYGNVVTSIIDHVPEIKTVDIDLGQLEEKPPQIPYEEPAVLFRIENIIWNEYDASKQIGLVHLRLRLIFAFDNDDENYTIAHTVRTQVNDFALMSENIHNALMTMSPHNHTKLFRFNQRHHIVEDKTLVWMHVIDYMCNVFSDNSELDPNNLMWDYDQINRANVLFERRRLIP
jgi:hypothetical protein